MSSVWLEESTEVLRVLINDMSDAPTYNDNTLEQMILAGAKYVVQEIRLETSYTVNFLGGSITPDPSNDNTFLNFIILKAACLNQHWKFNESAIANGIKAKLGPAELSIDIAPSILITLLTYGPCKTYEELRDQSRFGSIGSLRAILSPFISNTYLPENNYNYRSANTPWFQ